jgi:hypothetical protein
LNARLLFFVFLALLLFELPFVNALKGQYTFDRATYFQGENGTVAITLYNDNPLFQWNIKEVGIQFDWQQPQNLWFSNTVNQNIASGQSYTISISFAIDNSVSVRSHSFAIKYVGAFHDTNTVVTGTLYVHDIYEKLSLQIRPDAAAKLQTAQNAVSNANGQISAAQFSSSSAQSYLGQSQQSLTQANAYLSQAQTGCHAADSEFNGGSFQAAYNDYKQCAASADAATNAAQTARQQFQNARDAESQANNPFAPSGGNPPNYGWLAWLVVGLIVAAVIGGVAVQASKPKQSQSTVTQHEVRAQSRTKLVHCIYCGNRILPTATFCDKCGRSQK